MTVQAYPRVETIVVPDDILPEYIGKYVSSKVGALIGEVGMEALVPRTNRLSASANNDRLFFLYFDTTAQYALPKDLDIRRLDTAERTPVAEVPLAVRDQGGPIKGIKAGTTKR